MRTITFVALLSFGFAGSLAWSDELANKPATYEWSKSRSVVTDFNRNGSPDEAELGVGKDRVGLRIRLDGKLLPIIEIPIDGSKQFGICPGAPPSIRSTPRPETHADIVEEMPIGNEICADCVGVDVIGGECDTLHFYWDPESRSVGWWRN